MRILRKTLIGTVLFALVCGLLAGMTGPRAAALDRGNKTVVIACKPGWRGGAGGAYGGVAFDVSCASGKGRTTITGTVGTTYSIRMGVESASGALDCAFSGDAPVVSESCGVVGLTIR